tara:strand:- start:205 stop:915 length:711 start_codon:yes stop_codon:yes gene_type:complete
MVKSSSKVLNEEEWMVQPQFSNINLRAAFSLKSIPVKGLEGRRSFAKKAGFDPKGLVIPKQTHSTNVSFAKSVNSIENCDGVFTDEKDIVCSIQVADCMPIYFAHSSKNVYGLVHAGWRGLVYGILESTSQLIFENGYKLHDFEVFIGPSIQKCCFEIRDDIVGNFKIGCVTPTQGDGKYNVDLQYQACREMIQIGFKKNQIKVSTECTYCSQEKYHSFRRDGKDSGRMIGLIGSA